MIIDKTIEYFSNLNLIYTETENVAYVYYQDKKIFKVDRTINDIYVNKNFNSYLKTFISSEFYYKINAGLIYSILERFKKDGLCKIDIDNLTIVDYYIDGYEYAIPPSNHVDI